MKIKILRRVELKVANWYDKTTWDSTSTMDHAIHFSCQPREYCFVLIMIIHKLALRKSAHCFINKMLISKSHWYFSFDGQHYNKTEISKYSHRGTYGLANYQGNALSTGCNVNNAQCSLKTEIMDMTTLKWSDGPNYPLGSK